MQWFVDLFNSQKTVLEYALRLVLSLIAGGAIGLERERNSKGAGLRTHILIAVGSTLLMLLSITVATKAGSADPGRIAAQVVSGIGFIGAGTIMRFGGNVRGLTTAASIWIVAALGLAIGGGLYFLALVAVLLTLFTLTVLHQIERHIFTDRTYKVLEVNMSGTKISSDAIMSILEAHGIHVRNVDVTQAIQKKTVKMKFLIKIADEADLKELYTEINTVKNVIQVKLEQPQ